MAGKLYLTEQKANEELSTDLRNLTRFDEDFLIPGCIFTMMRVVGVFPDLMISSEAYKNLKKLVKTRIEALEKHEGRTKKKFGKQFSEDYELLLQIEEKHGFCKEPSPHHALRSWDPVLHSKRKAQG